MNILKKIALGISACVIASSAHAVDVSKFYVGASYLAEVNHDEFRAPLQGNIAPFTGDQKDQGFGLFAGYKFNEIVALELAYRDLGQSTSNLVYNAGTRLKTTTERQHGSLDVLLGKNFTPNFRAFAKVGYGAIYAEQTGTDDLLEFRQVVGVANKIGESESEFGMNYGVGLQYNYGKFFVRAEYEKLPEVGNKNLGPPASDPDLYSISIGSGF